MQQEDDTPLENALELYQDLIRKDKHLLAELESTVHEFFGLSDNVPPDRVNGRVGGRVEDRAESQIAATDPRKETGGDAHAASSAARRHLEWFLLERPSLALRRIPIDALEQAFEREAGPAERMIGSALRNSLASVFEVTGVELGRGVWLRDLAGFGEYPIDEPKASTLIEEGDLIVGRLFPTGGSAYLISRAAGFFRNPILRDALRSDLARAREARRGVLRIEQNELESMFWGSQAHTNTTEDADPVGEARRILLSGGVEADEAEELLKRLADAPFDPQQLVVGSDDILGAILDRLAFETAVDLEQARRVLVGAWATLSAEHETGASAALPIVKKPVATSRASQAPRTRSQTAMDPTEAIAAFDRGREKGSDLDALFDTLEHDLVLDEDAESDDGATAPDFPGVVGAMVEEYLWETSHQPGASASAEPTPESALLRSFGRFAASVGVFENLRVRDLLVYTSYWLPESGELANADQARGLLVALKGFCRWAEEKQEVKLFSAFRDTLDSLRSSLPRVIEANRRRTREAERSRGELHECVVGECGRITRLRDTAGDEHPVELDPWLSSWLQPGDRVRANRGADGRAAVYCCYPPEIAEVAGELSS